MKEELRKIVGNGENTKFWGDIWVGELPLRESFNKLYTLSEKKESQKSAR